jgi:tetratricopeptide (TPR) repeat protein
MKIFNLRILFYTSLINLTYFLFFVDIAKATDDCFKATKILQGNFLSKLEIKAQENNYRKALELCPTMSEAHYNLSLILMNKKKYNEAKKHLKIALKKKWTPEISSAYAQVLALTGDFESSKDEYNKIISKQPNFEAAKLGLGVVLWKFGKEEEAIIQFKKLLEAKEPHPLALFNLAAIYDAKKDFKVAKDYYLRLLEINREHRDAFVRLALIEHQNGNLSESVKFLEKVTEIYQDDAEAFDLLGGVKEELKDVKDAEIAYRKALTIEPKRISSSVHLVSLLIRLKRQNEALQVIRQTLQYEPNNSKALALEGTALLELGDLELAEKSLLNSLEYNKNEGIALYNLGLLYNYNGKNKLAKKYFEQANMLDPKLFPKNLRN